MKRSELKEIIREEIQKLIEHDRGSPIRAVRSRRHLPAGWTEPGLHLWKHKKTKFKIWVEKTSKDKYSILSQVEGQPKTELAKNKKYPDVINIGLEFVKIYYKGAPK